MTSSKPATEPDRNPGTDLHVEWLADLCAVGHGYSTTSPALGGASLDELLMAVRLLDLTSLDESDTEDTVRRLCARALSPLPEEIAHDPVHVAAVCVHDRLVPSARAALASQPETASGERVRVAAVTAGFPRPHADLEQRLDEVRATVAAGADEVDLVITREHALAADWDSLYTEVRALRAACGEAALKAILVAGELGSTRVVSAAGLVCCMAGADFIKSSTGRERVNATPPIGLAMAESIRCFADRTGRNVGLKAAGGIRSTDQALMWLRLVEECLGPGWMSPARFRIGASSLLDDIVRSARPTTGAED